MDTQTELVYNKALNDIKSCTKVEDFTLNVSILRDMKDVLVKGNEEERELAFVLVESICDNLLIIHGKTTK